ncbi:uncharacterized protein FIBRA_05585 [Fibroporia radiculosa]|uniref:F-box domain-containing protein n=1 Tax=Fibroporia radiculosa TaxID=599839 RepID=J4HXS7_9APHY|nr:uncharacterized protein FIBRA_05585 [Fibroporia radiculosa]CCM03452.1 predicted protein [Fibroporia radiculosa]
MSPMLDISRTSQLPPELWEDIIKYSTPSSLRACLSVSRLFHDLAVRFLFSTIHIQFGALSPHGLSPEEHERRVARNCSIGSDILCYIASKPSFAVVVKKIVVHSYMVGPYVFDRQLLIDAVSKLSNLSCFVWYGVASSVSATLVLNRPDLDPANGDIRIPLASSLPLRRIQNLRSLSLEWWADELEHEDPELELTEVRDMIEANTDTLQELEICAPHCRSFPLRTLRNLVYLHLIDAPLDNIETVFRYGDQLEALSIVPDVHCVQELFSVIASHPKRLPRLSSFKLIQSDDDEWRPDVSDMAALAEFFRTKNMRRLDCKLCVDCTTSLPFLQMLQNLKNLQVLGIGLISPTFVQNDSLSFTNYIPKNISALRLRLGYDGTIIGRDVILHLWDHFEGLRYAHIVVSTVPDITLAMLISSNSKQDLELIAYNGRVFPLERTIDNVCVGKSWSECKTTTRAVEDFGNEDWEWLSRHYMVYW